MINNWTEVNNNIPSITIIKLVLIMVMKLEFPWLSNQSELDSRERGY